MKTLLDTALEYAATGQPVYPVRQDNVPLTAHGPEDATTDAAKIRNWWARWPSAQIGVTHGNGTAAEPVSYERLHIKNLENFPGEAKTSGAFWVCWKEVPSTGAPKPRKVPINPHTGEPAKANDPVTWGTFAAAVARFERDTRLAGIGLYFSKPDMEDEPDKPVNDYAGIDLDGCRDSKTGLLEPWAADLVLQVDSYCEVSPSRTGVKIFIRASAAGRGCSFQFQGHKCEFYDRGRYFAVTGKRLPEAPAVIQDRQRILDSLLPPPPERPLAAPPVAIPRAEDPLAAAVDAIPDAELVERIKKSKQGAKFAALMDGSTLGYAGYFTASAALCAILAAWTRANPERIDRIYRTSGLFEPRWEAWWGRGRSEYIITKACERAAIEWMYDPTIERPEVVALLQEFNEKFYVVEDFGGKCRVCWEESDTSFKLGKPLLNHQSFPDFRNRFMHLKVKVGEDEEGEAIYESKSKVWLGHHDRRQYAEVQFAPGFDLGPDIRNLWHGFAFEPKPGDCSKYLAHVRDNICQGNQDHYDWLIRWMAYGARHPAENGQVAIVLRGKKGVGKNVFAEGFNHLWGRHGIVLNSEKHVTSNFNAHLLGKCSLVADEAFFAGDPRQARLLKGLVTGETLAIESKGVNVIVVPNFLHIIIIGNDDWLVSATGDERRFFALECGDAHREDHAYFAAIAEELKSGGHAALLHHLQYEVDLGDFNVRKAPHTAVLRDQMAESTEGAAGLWLECLWSGELPASELNVKNDDGTVWLHLASLLEFGGKRNSKQWGRVTTKQMSGVLGKKGKHAMEFKSAPRVGNDLRRWEIPTLSECRALWDKKRYKVDWPEDDGDWNVAPAKPTCASPRSGGRSGGT